MNARLWFRIAPMSADRSGELTPQMAVLGLIARGPNSIATIAARLNREFPHANFARNTAHNALPRLATHGYTRVVREGEQSTDNVYEITPKGLRHFEERLYDEADRYVQRDPVGGLLAFTALEHLGRTIETVRAYEEAAADRYAATHGLIHGLTIRDLAGSPSLELERIRLEYLAALWGQQAKRMTGVREKLEHLQARLPNVDS